MIIEHEIEKLLPKLPRWPFTPLGNILLLVLALLAIVVGTVLSNSIMEMRGLM